jgi:hypothetical protein
MAWQLLKKVGDEATAAHVEKLAVNAGDDSIQTLDDLCWQTIFLCEVGREKYADRIAANIARIKKEQKPDGSWSYRFNDKPAEFATATALFALAKAGLTIDDPAVLQGRRLLADEPKTLRRLEHRRSTLRSLQHALQGDTTGADRRFPSCSPTSHP